MQKRTWWITIGLASGAIALVLVELLRPNEPTVSEPPTALQSSCPAETDLESPATPPSQPAAPAPVAAATSRVDEVAPGTVVRIEPTRTLALVNGAPLTLKNLAGIPAIQAVAEQALTPVMYDFLLNRAIEREVVLQAARTQNVTLTPEQEQQLAQMKELMETTAPDVRQLTMSPERAAFEIADAAGLMLQANLVAKAGVPSPYVTPEVVEQYYREHQADYGELPSAPLERAQAWKEIDSKIRHTLAPQIQSRYDQASAELLAKLKATANITVAPSAAN